MVIIYIVVKIVLIFINHIPGLNLGSLSSFFSSLDTLSNIFAWANLFVPVGLINTLLSITFAVYSLQFFVSLFNILISLFGGMKK